MIKKGLTCQKKYKEKFSIFSSMSLKLKIEKIPSNSNEISENLWEIFLSGHFIKNVSKVGFNVKVL